MEFISCLGCGTQVLPMRDGICPSCRRPIDETNPTRVDTVRNYSAPAEPFPPLGIAVVAGAMVAVIAVHNAAVSGIFSPNTIIAAVIALEYFHVFVFMK